MRVSQMMNITDENALPKVSIVYLMNSNELISVPSMLNQPINNSVENNALRGGGYSLKKKIWDAARDTIEDWTGEELTECSLYGIRVYKENAILATHVDRLPLVSSAIINVASDLDEPWPLEVYGHDGKAYNVTMEPGDMVGTSFWLGRLFMT